MLARGGRSASSFSVDLGDANQDGLPELPEFLNSVAGPIHSFHDSDTVIFDEEPETRSEVAA